MKKDIMRDEITALLMDQIAANKPSPYPKPGTPWPTPRGAPGPILPPLPWQPPDWALMEQDDAKALRGRLPQYGA